MLLTVGVYFRMIFHMYHKHAFFTVIPQTSNLSINHAISQLIFGLFKQYYKNIKLLYCILNCIWYMSQMYQPCYQPLFGLFKQYLKNIKFLYCFKISKWYMSQYIFRIIGQDVMINCFQKIFGLILNSILSMFFFTLPKESFMKSHVN